MLAAKRMFSLAVADTDLFLEMPSSTQALYFHLGLRADDDGFVSSPKKIAKICGCGEDDLKILASKHFILPFESGVVVITHWLLNNNRIKSDRYKQTLYIAEKSMLEVENGVYMFTGSRMYPERNQNGDITEPQIRLDKSREEKNRVNNNGRKTSRFTPPTVEEVQEYCSERGNAVDAQSFVDFYISKDWYIGKNKMKDWKAAVRTWEKNQRQKNKKSKDDEGLKGWLNA